LHPSADDNIVVSHGDYKIALAIANFQIAADTSGVTVPSQLAGSFCATNCAI
jgi:hypothetical protein